jgi:hypothetical protein
VGLDLGDLVANLVEQPADPVVLGGDGFELGTGEVELRVQVGRAALQLCQLGALPVEGGRQRLLRRLSVCELCAGLGQFGLGISGKGRAAGLC